MGNCCTSNPGGTGPELNSNTQENKAAHTDSGKQPDAASIRAIVMVQAFFRGWKARKDVKRVHQFECRTMNRKQ